MAASSLRTRLLPLNPCRACAAHALQLSLQHRRTTTPYMQQRRTCSSVERLAAFRAAAPLGHVACVSAAGQHMSSNEFACRQLPVHLDGHVCLS